MVMSGACSYHNRPNGSASEIRSTPHIPAAARFHPITGGINGSYSGHGTFSSDHWMSLNGSGPPSSEYFITLPPIGIITLSLPSWLSSIGTTQGVVPAAWNQYQPTSVGVLVDQFMMFTSSFLRQCNLDDLHVATRYEHHRNQYGNANGEQCSFHVDLDSITKRREP